MDTFWVIINSACQVRNYLIKTDNHTPEHKQMIEYMVDLVHGLEYLEHDLSKKLQTPSDDFGVDG